MPFEVREVGWPELLVAGNPLRDVGERDRRELVDALPPVDSRAALLPHQARIAQHPQMSRHCRPAYPEAGRDLARRRGTPPPDSIGEFHPPPAMFFQASRVACDADLNQNEMTSPNNPPEETFDPASPE